MEILGIAILLVVFVLFCKLMHYAMFTWAPSLRGQRRRR